MELILMSVLTILAVMLGIYIGSGSDDPEKNRAYFDAGYDEGYEKGIAKASEDFPKTIDGNFLSRENAIKQMSIKDDD